MKSDRYAIEAQFLTGAQIGRTVQFTWLFPDSRVQATVIGELRQVYHVTGEVVLNLTSHEADGADLTEFTLDDATSIIVWGAMIEPEVRPL